MTFLRDEPRAWSVTLEVPTAAGRLWFKETCPALAFEPALTQALERHAPGYTPEVVATGDARMLVADAGPPRAGLDRASSPAWLDTVARYAELQLAVAPAARDLPARDSRPETLAARFGDEVEPLVETVGDAVPLSVVHLCVQPKHVCDHDGRIVFIDWGASAYAHPFSGLVETFHKLARRLGGTVGGPELRRVRDAYLEPWSVYASPAELRRIFGAANALGALCRVADWEAKLAGMPEDVRRRWAKKVDLGMRIFAALAEQPEALGAVAEK